MIRVLSLTQSVKDWLTNSSQPRVLHVFDDACNLLDKRKEVLSIVTQGIGNGPFNLVVEEDALFSKRVSVQARVVVSQTKLTVGDLTFNIAAGTLWNPHPDWGQLHSMKSDILHQLTSFSFPVHKLSIPRSLLSDFTASIVTADASKASAFVQKISGLGVGLTPEGDDFIMGAVLAAWVIHPQNVASVLAHEITNVAAPLTTSLSAAWLKAAGRGEAGSLWHDLFNAFLSADKMAVEESKEKILGVGHTSGADALTGFLGVFNSFAEQK